MRVRGSQKKEYWGYLTMDEQKNLIVVQIDESEDGGTGGFCELIDETEDGGTWGCSRNN
jgi:hypothetical protein